MTKWLLFLSIFVTQCYSTTLEWQANYIFDNEVTVVFYSNDLTIPKNQWQIISVDRAESLDITTTNQSGFYFIYNAIKIIDEETSQTNLFFIPYQNEEINFTNQGYNIFKYETN